MIRPTDSLNRVAKGRVALTLSCALFMLLTSVLPAVAQVVREPYLQLTTPASVTIVWRTGLTSANNSQVEYGTDAGNLDQTATGTPTIPPSNAAVKDHVVTVTGLSPATTYFYNVGTGTDGVQGGGTTEHYFVTAPSVGTAMPFTAWVVGDSGSGSVDQQNVRDAMLAETGATPPDLFLHAGDIAYEDGTDAEFTSNHFAIYEDILRHTPLWPTLGNHEAVSVNTALGTGPYYEAHVLPTGGEAGGVPSGTEAYYSFDYANAHFIVLDSMDSNRAPGSSMLTWLQADLSGTAQQWVIVYFHHPPYTKGTHNSDSAADSGGRLVDMREDVLPILEAGGVDLVLAGHSHIYERSYPLLGAYGYGSSPNFATPDFGTLFSNGNILETGDGDPSGNGAYQNGPVYVVAGHGGKSVGGTGGHPVMFFSEALFGSMLLDINGPILTVQNVRSTGAITDTFSINKTVLIESLKTLNTLEDVDGDGKDDILWQHTNGDVAWWLGNGLTLGATGIIATGVDAAWTIRGAGDLSGDGKADIEWRHTNGDVAGWLGNGLTLGATGIIATGVDAAWTIQGEGDVDGDGKDDIVWQHTNGDVAVWLGNGLTLGATGVIATGVDAAWTIRGVGDVSGDGKADIVWRHTNGDVAVWLGNGLTLGATGIIATAVDAAWTICGVGDVSGDGKDDIVWQHTNGDVAVWLGNGLTLGATGIIATGVDAAWTIRGVGDVSGDGKDDIVWRHTNGDVAVWLGNGLTLGATGIIATGVDAAWSIQP